MKGAVRLSVSLILAVVFFSIFVIPNTKAQTNQLTQQQIEQIRGNCSSLKSTLNQLHASDALLRVNMGQRYESMFTKLMDRFNGRLSTNRFNNSDLLVASISYQMALDTFRLDYMAYEESLVAIIKIDCVSQPNDFYNGINSTRDRRNQVYADIVKLNQNIDNYHSKLDQFNSYYKSLNLEAKQ